MVDCAELALFASAQSRLRRCQLGGDRFVVSCSLNISNLIVCTSFGDVQKNYSVQNGGLHLFEVMGGK